MNFMNRVLPELRNALAYAPQLQLPDDLESARKIPFMPPYQSEHIRIECRFVPGYPENIRVKIYEPLQRTEKPLPAILWIHGGGYVLGHPDFDDSICERFVRELNCVVVSVDYRLAPEHPYPAAVEDCYATLLWMMNESNPLNIHAERVAVAGSSAGGGLAAAVCLMARDKGGPAIAFQMLLYPMIDDRNITPSSHEITSRNAIWNRSNNIAAWKMYLGEHASEVPPYAAPTREDHLAGLPPSYICVGELDLFRDESMNYAARMTQAGVPVEFHLYPGCYHGFDALAPDADVSKRASKEYIAALARALQSQG